jgi:hypothetical protein
MSVNTLRDAMRDGHGLISVKDFLKLALDGNVSAQGIVGDAVAQVRIDVAEATGPKSTRIIDWARSCRVLQHLRARSAFDRALLYLPRRGPAGYRPDRRLLANAL